MEGELVLFPRAVRLASKIKLAFAIPIAGPVTRELDLFAGRIRAQAAGRILACLAQNLRLTDAALEDRQIALQARKTTLVCATLNAAAVTLESDLFAGSRATDGDATTVHFAPNPVRMAAGQAALRALDAQGAQVAAGEDARDAQDALHARRAAAALTRKAGEHCAILSADRATTMLLAAFARQTVPAE